MARMEIRRDKRGRPLKDKEGRFKKFYRGSRVHASFINKKFYQLAIRNLSQHELTPAIIVPPYQRRKYWYSQKRYLTLTYVVFSVYEEDFLRGDFSNLFISKVIVFVNTSIACLPRLLKKIEPMVEEEMKMREPTSVVLGSVLTEIKVGRRTKEKTYYPEKAGFESRRKYRKKLKEMS